MKQMLCRDSKIFRRGILPALVLLALLAALCAAAAFSAFSSAAQGTEPSAVALVDAEDSLVSRICISVVEQQDFMQALLRIEPYDSEAEAVAAVEDGRCAAAILLPDGYTDAILTGQRCTGRIVLSDAAAGSADLVAAAAQFGELLLSAGQQAVFSGEELLARHGSGSAAHSAYLKTVNPALLSAALDVYDGGFTVVTASYAGSGLDPACYFASCWAAALLLLCGLFFPELYTADLRQPLLARLSACGVKPGQFLCGKLLFPALFRLAAAAGLFAALRALLPLRVTFLSLLCLLLAVVSAGACTLCAAVCLREKGGWMGAFTAAAALGLFLMGGVIPRGMLPAALPVLGSLTPLGAVQTLLRPSFGASPDALGAAAAAVYAVSGILLSRRAVRRMGREALRA